MGTSPKTALAPVGLAREPRSPQLQTLCGKQVRMCRLYGCLTWTFPEGWVTRDTAASLQTRQPAWV